MKKGFATLVLVFLFARGQLQPGVLKEPITAHRGKINLIQIAKTNVPMEIPAGSWALSPRLKPVGLISIPTTVTSGSLDQLRYRDLCFNQLLAGGTVDGRPSMKLAEGFNGASYSLTIGFLSEPPDFEEIAKTKRIEDFGKEFWIRPEVDSGYFTSGVFWRSSATGILRILWIEGKSGRGGIQEFAIWVGNLDSSDCSAQ